MTLGLGDQNRCPALPRSQNNHLANPARHNRRRASGHLSEYPSLSKSVLAMSTCTAIPLKGEATIWTARVWAGVVATSAFTSIPLVAEATLWTMLACLGLPDWASLLKFTLDCILHTSLSFRIDSCCSIWINCLVTLRRVNFSGRAIADRTLLTSYR